MRRVYEKKTISNSLRGKRVCFSHMRISRAISWYDVREAGCRPAAGRVRASKEEVAGRRRIASFQDAGRASRIASSPEGR
ncbi:hypothetical protein HMPREF0762_00922 [Slackia exigua ATCC 700122]|uniref:Uncharacterized protein n=1 Tax=Slackia exigua (strain ATCC 700122 / DSM 15923 / CIP 105133 / JCM 11022 / KCTC 5966 / S-7) TaxID=649764 RepID=D0WGG9_SLAES|nr:hypothetical protein HMPREF0762_00922 [Slackia exigua ATCC 700122]